MRVYLDYGDGFQEVTQYVIDSSLVYTRRAASKTYHRAQNVASFSLKYQYDLYLGIDNATTDIQVYITTDTGTRVFTGIVPPTMSRDYNGKLDNIIINLEAVDSSTKLDVECGELYLTDCTLMNPADTAHSLVHQLVYRAGWDDTRIDQTITIPTAFEHWAPNREKDTILDILDILLFEHGYIFNLDENDDVAPIAWIREHGTVPVWNEQTILNTIQLEEDQQEYDGIKLAWYEIAERANTRIYSADLPTDSENTFTGEMVLNNFYWPMEANGVDRITGTNTIVYQDYSDTSIAYYTNYAIVNGLDYRYKAFDSDFSSILATTDHVLSASVSGLTLTEDNFWNKRAQILYQNLSGSSGRIYYLHIDATVIYKSTERLLEAGITTISGRTDTYQSYFVYNTTAADKLARNMMQMYGTGGRSYTVSTDEDVAEGSLVHLITNDNTNQICFVLEKRYEEKLGYFTYQLRGYNYNEGVLFDELVLKATDTSNAALRADAFLAQLAARALAISGANAFKYASGASVPVPTNLTLTATPNAFTPSTYQWQYHTGSAWANLANESGEVSGATTAALTIYYNATVWGSATALRLRCLADSEVWEEITLLKVADGAAGATGAQGVPGGQNYPPNWDMAYSDVGTFFAGTVERVTTASVEAGCPFTYCLKSTVRDATARTAIPVVAGQKYKVEAWVNASLAAYHLNTGLYFRATEGGTAFGWATVQTIAPGTAGWIKVSGTITVPATATLAYLWCNSNGSSAFGSAYWTGITVSRTEAALDEAKVYADATVKATTGLGFRFKASTFTDTNDGEIYMHGFTTAGVAADVDGFVYRDNAKITVTKGMVNANLAIDGYLLLPIAGGAVIPGIYNLAGDKFQSANGAIADITEANYLAIGEICLTGSETLESASLYERPLRLAELKGKRPARFIGIASTVATGVRAVTVWETTTGGGGYIFSGTSTRQARPGDCVFCRGGTNASGASDTVKALRVFDGYYWNAPTTAQYATYRELSLLKMAEAARVYNTADVAIPADIDAAFDVLVANQVFTDKLAARVIEFLQSVSARQSQVEGAMTVGDQIIYMGDNPRISADDAENKKFGIAKFLGTAGTTEYWRDHFISKEDSSGNIGLQMTGGLEARGESIITDKLFSLFDSPAYDPEASVAFGGGYPLCIVNAYGTYYLLRANATTTLSVFTSPDGFVWPLAATATKTLASSSSTSCVTSAVYMNGFIYFCCNNILYKLAIASNGTIGALTTISSTGFNIIVPNPSNTVLWIHGTSARSYQGAYIRATTGAIVSSILAFRTITWKTDTVFIGVYGHEYDGGATYGNTTVYEYTYTGTLQKTTSLSGKVIQNNGGYTLATLGPVIYSNGTYAVLLSDTNNKYITAYSNDDLGTLTKISDFSSWGLGEFDFFTYKNYAILCRGQGKTYLSKDYMQSFELINTSTTESFPDIGFMRQTHPFVVETDGAIEIYCSYVNSSNKAGYKKFIFTQAGMGFTSRTVDANGQTYYSLQDGAKLYPSQRDYLTLTGSTVAGVYALLSNYLTEKKLTMIAFNGSMTIAGVGNKQISYIKWSGSGAISIVGNLTAGITDTWTINTPDGRGSSIEGLVV